MINNRDLKNLHTEYILIILHNYPLCRGRGTCRWFFGDWGVGDDFSDSSTYGLSTIFLSGSCRRSWLLPFLIEKLFLTNLVSNFISINYLALSSYYLEFVFLFFINEKKKYLFLTSRSKTGVSNSVTCGPHETHAHGPHLKSEKNYLQIFS